MTRLDKPNPPGPNAMHKVDILLWIFFFVISITESAVIYVCSVYIIFLLGGMLDITRNVDLLALASILLAIIPATMMFRKFWKDRPGTNLLWHETKGRD